MFMQSGNNPESLRISVDAKAKVNIGDFSRNGKPRDREAKKAADHDMNPDLKLVLTVFSASSRTQFIRRMTEFSDKSGLKIRLIYYPPYHSKYLNVSPNITHSL